ncbi:MAG: hypothetical protein ABII82_07515 [Verrucomicrobiota bacterium]
MNTLPFKLQTLVEAELRPAERPLWTGTPRPWRMARQCLPVVLFAIPWTAFSVFWIAGASGFKMPDFSSPAGFFPLFGLPFLLIGAGMLASPWLAMRKARRTAYVLTAERAIIFEATLWGGINIRSFGPDQLTDLRRVQSADGSGDLIFDEIVNRHHEGRGTTTAIGFLGIPDVRSVETMVATLAEPARARRAD